MFGPVQPTEFDVQFRLLGIPVRVLPWFWVLALLLGRRALNEGWEHLVVWVVVVFFSILVHEMGHALTARAFGYAPRVFLYHFGGVAMYTPDNSYSQGRSILITFAGPAAGLALGGLSLIGSLAVTAFEVPTTPLAEDALFQLTVVNLAWSVLNLLPVLPLDGGQITRDVLTSMNPARGEVRAMWISLVVAGLVSFGAFSTGMTFAGIMFALMCYQNFQTLQMRRHWR